LAQISVRCVIRPNIAGRRRKPLVDTDVSPVLQSGLVSSSAQKRKADEDDAVSSGPVGELAPLDRITDSANHLFAFPANFKLAKVRKSKASYVSRNKAPCNVSFSFIFGSALT
jgi:hypothetical protein